ncbi:MAG: PucR family transcriptional regulator [Propionibacteriaceae bacterium]
MAADARAISKSLAPTPRTRAAIAKRLATHVATITTATVSEMEARHRWFARLDADNRSWITLVARDGIDGFVQWFADPEHAGSSTAVVFGSAPRELARKISLQQTVELVRTTIDVVEHQVDALMPRADKPILQAAIFQYSRDVAFSAAEIYARAAELRGAWDVRLEALVVDAVLRGETDETVLSRASTLGWRSTAAVVVVVGPAPESDGQHVVEDVRRIAARSRLDTLGSVQGDRLVIVLGGPQLTQPDTATSLVVEFAHRFGPGPVVIGPVVEHLIEANASTRAAVSGFRAALAWPQAPRPVLADELLPERALAGDGHARRQLATDIYELLAATSGELLETLVSFLDSGSSVEATARALFVHANTVRYRLKRIHEVTGYSPLAARDAYALRLALTLGRLLHT